MSAHDVQPHDLEDDEPLIIRRKVVEADLDITPMIDVVFLLLIFFMVSSTMQKPADNDPPPAVNGVGVESRGAVTISINKPTDPQTPPEILLSNGKPGSLEEVTADIKAAKAEGIGGKPLEDVIIKADRDVKHGFVTKVMRAVNEVEGMHLHVQVKDANE